MLDIPGSMLKQWQENISISTSSTRGQNASFAPWWEKPMDGWLKINSIFQDGGIIGLGWVIRDASKAFLVARSTLILMQLCQNNEAKAMGVREALSWIK